MILQVKGCAKNGFNFITYILKYDPFVFLYGSFHLGEVLVKKMHYFLWLSHLHKGGIASQITKQNCDVSHFSFQRYLSFQDLFTHLRSYISAKAYLAEIPVPKPADHLIGLCGDESELIIAHNRNTGVIFPLTYVLHNTQLAGENGPEVLRIPSEDK